MLCSVIEIWNVNMKQEIAYCKPVLFSRCALKLPSCCDGRLTVAYRHTQLACLHNYLQVSQVLLSIHQSKVFSNRTFLRLLHKNIGNGCSLSCCSQLLLWTTFQDWHISGTGFYSSPCLKNHIMNNIHNSQFIYWFIFNQCGYHVIMFLLLSAN